ncbi:MAG: Smr/MutS family protein [Magnetovibrio sp.]|nr:Smr/MutS family protein [Magnetovibrio sp.]
MTTRRRKGPKTGAATPASDEDAFLWSHATQNVTPLKTHQNKITENTQAKRSGAAIQRRRHHPPELQDKITPRSLPMTHGKAPGLDKRTELRLRRGQVKIESRVDLHGMTQMEAHEALIRFIEEAYLSSKKTLLVITGKGTRPDGAIGVLRSAVPRWLNEPPMRQWVRAFDHAAPADGGEGALYVLLRRRK